MSLTTAGGGSVWPACCFFTTCFRTLWRRPGISAKRAAKPKLRMKKKCACKFDVGIPVWSCTTNPKIGTLQLPYHIFSPPGRTTYDGFTVSQRPCYCTQALSFSSINWRVAHITNSSPVRDKSLLHRLGACCGSRPPRKTKPHLKPSFLVASSKVTAFHPRFLEIASRMTNVSPGHSVLNPSVAKTRTFSSKPLLKESLKPGVPLSTDEASSTHPISAAKTLCARVTFSRSGLTTSNFAARKSWESSWWKNKND